jgi:hypothetical protein
MTQSPRSKKVIYSDPDRKPVALPVVPEHIPQELKDRPQWVAWRYTWKKDKKKWDKPPINARNGKAASSTNPSTWCLFDDALAFHRAGCANGIGFVFTNSDPYFGVDWDDCRDSVTGTIRPEVWEEVVTLNSYCEVSPSETGIKLIALGRLPGAGKKDTKRNREIYDQERYFTVTGQGIPNTSADIRDASSILEPFYSTFHRLPKEPPAQSQAPDSGQTSSQLLTDEEIIQYLTVFAKNAAKGRALWNGSSEGYQSESEADFALCSLIAFYTGRDSDRIDKLFRQSKLFRTKWDVPANAKGVTYGQLTIAKVLDGKKEFYTGPKLEVDRGESESTDDEVPTIIQTTEEHSVAEKCLMALMSDPDLYQRGTEFARVGTDPETMTPTMRLVESPDLRRRLTKYSQLGKIVPAKGNKPATLQKAHPASWLMPMLMTHPTKEGIRILSGISNVPVIRADGSIHDRPGYDDRSRVLFIPGAVNYPAIPENLTQDDAVCAALDLLDLICDFPCVNPAGRSVFLSIVLSCLVRHLIHGNVPLHLIDSSTPGTGKGLIVDTFGQIVLGGAVPTQQYEENNSEMKKIITTVVMEAKPLVHLDNLPNGEKFGNPALASAITSTVWTDRILSLNRSATLPNRVVWVATGNNPQYKDDIGRRVVRCRIEPDRANPEERSDFKYPKLIKHVTEHRSRYVVDALTIIAAYLRAGRPEISLPAPAAGSFTEWTDLIRNAIVWAGCPDPWITNRDARVEIDSDISELAVLIDAWQELDPNGNGITTNEAKKRFISNALQFPKTTDLLSVLNLKEFDSSAIGYRLRRHKRRPLSDGRLLLDSNAGGNVTRWRVTLIQKTSANTPTTTS